VDVKRAGPKGSADRPSRGRQAKAELDPAPPSHGRPRADVQRPRAKLLAKAVATLQPHAFKYLTEEQHRDVLGALTHGEVVWSDPRQLFGGTRPELLWLKASSGAVYQGVFKPHDSAFQGATWRALHQHEVDAYVLSEGTKLGLVPPTVERALNGHVGSLQLLVGEPPADRIGPDASFPRTTGGLGAAERPLFSPTIVVPLAQTLYGARPSRFNEEDFANLMAFNYIFEVGDRSPRNMLVPVLGIDHGLFAVRGWTVDLWQREARALMWALGVSPHHGLSVKAWVRQLDAGQVEGQLKARGYPPQFNARALRNLAEVKEYGLPWPALE